MEQFMEKLKAKPPHGRIMERTCRLSDVFLGMAKLFAPDLNLNHIAGVSDAEDNAQDGIAILLVIASRIMQDIYADAGEMEKTAKKGGGA